VRLVVVPAILFVVVSAAVFGFAKWHPAKQEAAATDVGALPGDPVRGQRLFEERCESCHGEGGQGGGVGPTLVGSTMSISEARTRIVNGGGVMPANLVTGQNLEDVLAYVRFVFAS
jgi:mono/diheme cytochrome c family protein